MLSIYPTLLFLFLFRALALKVGLVNNINKKKKIVRLASEFCCVRFRFLGKEGRCEWKTAEKEKKKQLRVRNYLS